MDVALSFFYYLLSAIVGVLLRVLYVLLLDYIHYCNRQKKKDKPFDLSFKGFYFFSAKPFSRVIYGIVFPFVGAWLKSVYKRNCRI